MTPALQFLILLAAVWANRRYQDVIKPSRQRTDISKRISKTRTQPVLCLDANCETSLVPTGYGTRRAPDVFLDGVWRDYTRADAASKSAGASIGT